MSQAPPPEIRFTQDYVSYQPLEQLTYPIPQREWNRLKTKIQTMTPPRNTFQILYSVSAGAAASALFSVVTLYTLKDPPNWLTTTTWTLFLVTVLAAVMFFFVDRALAKSITTSSQEILGNMGFIEAGFRPPPPRYITDPESDHTGNVEPPAGPGQS